jgi:Lrp/AsnC family transcriptional regulator for asnA, asnC and gidA
LTTTPETTISVATKPPTARARHRRGHADTIDTIDAIDVAIVRELQKDGRMAYRKLGSRVGLSEAAARQRVQRLLARGVMQIAAVTDPVRLGSKSMALVGIKARGDSRKIAKAIGALPESIYVVATAGPYDVIAEIVCENHEHLLRVSNEKIRTLRDVSDAVILMYLGTYKHVFTYSVN